MRAIVLAIAVLAGSCIPAAQALTPPLSVAEQLAALTGQSIEIPAALAGMSAGEIYDLMQQLPANVALEAVQIVPGVGPAFVQAAPVNCADSESFANAVGDARAGTITTAAVGKLRDPFNRRTLSYTCQNTSTTLVQVGDSAIVDPDVTRRGPVYCATNCPSQEWGGNAYIEYCRGATDTTVYCRFLVAVADAP